MEWMGNIKTWEAHQNTRERERSPMVRDQRARAISKSNVKTEVHNPNKLILFDNKSRIMDRNILNSLADPL